MQGCATQGVQGGPGTPQYLVKNIHKSQKKGALKFSSHYLGPLNNYGVVHTLVKEYYGNKSQLVSPAHTWS